MSDLTTVDGLLAAARRHGLSLTAASTEPDQMGLDFLVVHAVDTDNTPWILRTPRRRDVVETARIEARVLALVRARLPVAVPDWQVHTDELIAYPRIAGTPAVTMVNGAPTWHVIDPAAPSTTFLDSMARVLAAMQAISLDDARAAGITVRDVDATRTALAHAADVARDALHPSQAVWSRWQRWLASEWPQALALVHGDLHPGHMLLDDDGRLVGILDWTEASFTDASVDLAMFHGCFGRPALARLLSRFQHHGGTVWPGLVEHAAERWAFSSALGAEWALRTGSLAVLEHVRGMLEAIEAE